jgi:uncharacterized protein YjbI with pentapeptide repeats
MDGERVFSGDTIHLQVFREAAQKNDPRVWNCWRDEHNVERPNLRGADLSGLVLREVNLQFADLTEACLTEATITGSFDYAVLNKANLTDARMWSCRFEETQLVDATCHATKFCGSRIVASNFTDADLQKADFERCYLEDTFFDAADLTGATFYQADLWMAFLRGATLDHVNFRSANLHGAKLAGASMTACDLRRTVLVDSDLQGTTIRDCDVYGVSAWGLLRDESTNQRNLRVSKEDESPLYVDDIEVAQFIYLIVQSPRVRDVIDTISRKGVLILGRFTPERKSVLDAIRTRLREFGYVPMIFDFEKPTQRDLEETVKILAGLSRFVIVDITNPSSSPLEIRATVPDYMIPFVPIIECGEKPFSMFEGLQAKYDWVCDTVEYPSAKALLRALDTEIIAPVLAMEAKIAEKRARSRAVRRISE